MYAVHTGYCFSRLANDLREPSAVHQFEWFAFSKILGLLSEGAGCHEKAPKGLL